MALNLTPEDIQKLQDKQLANAIRKVTEGKTLTAAERALLAGAGGNPSTPATGYAKSWDDLAAALSVDEKTLFDFRKRHAPAVKKAGKTLTRADGRHVVAEWRAFADNLGELNGRGVNDPCKSEADYLNERSLKLRALKLDLDRKEFELAKQKDELIEKANVQIALGHVMSQFRQSLDSMPSRLARLLGDVDVKGKARELVRAAAGEIAKVRTEDGVFQIVERLVIRSLPEPDYHSRLDVITREIEILKGTLRACPFIQPDDETPQ